MPQAEYSVEPRWTGLVRGPGIPGRRVRPGATGGRRPGGRGRDGKSAHHPLHPHDPAGGCPVSSSGVRGVYVSAVCLKSSAAAGRIEGQAPDGPSPQRRQALCGSWTPRSPPSGSWTSPCSTSRLAQKAAASPPTRRPWTISRSQHFKKGHPLSPVAYSCRYHGGNRPP